MAEAKSQCRSQNPTKEEFLRARCEHRKTQNTSLELSFLDPGWLSFKITFSFFSMELGILAQLFKSLSQPRGKLGPSLIYEDFVEQSTNFLSRSALWLQRLNQRLIRCVQTMRRKGRTAACSNAVFREDRAFLVQAPYNEALRKAIDRVLCNVAERKSVLPNVPSPVPYSIQCNLPSVYCLKRTGSIETESIALFPL